MFKVGAFVALCNGDIYTLFEDCIIENGKGEGILKPKYLKESMKLN